MLVVFVALLLALSLMISLYSRAPRLDYELDLLLSVLVEFVFCMFVFVPLVVSSGPPMFNLGS